MSGHATRAKILALMEKRRLTERQLARKLNWYGDDLVALLGGRRQFTVTELQAIAKALGVTPEDLLDEEDLESHPIFGLAEVIPQPRYAEVAR